MKIELTFYCDTIQDFLSQIEVLKSKVLSESQRLNLNIEIDNFFEAGPDFSSLNISNDDLSGAYTVNIIDDNRYID